MCVVIVDQIVGLKEYFSKKKRSRSASWSTACVMCMNESAGSSIGANQKVRLRANLHITSIIRPNVSVVQHVKKASCASCACIC